MGRKDLERLVGKLRYMHLAVPGVVAYLYHIQHALAQAGADRAWLSLDFHREIADWRMLAEHTANRPTHLADIIRHKPTHLGFCGASGLGDGGVWLDPSCSGEDLVWRHPWPEDIIANLVSFTNMEGTTTNSDLELATLVLHEATLLAAVPDVRLPAPHPGSDNTPTVSCSTEEFSMINLVVADLLRICALHLRQFFINPSVFITRESKIAWQMTPLDFLTFLTPSFSPTCLLPTPSRKVRARSPSLLRICFLA